MAKALKQNNMKKGPFKMGGYTYPGMSPIENKKKLEISREKIDTSLENKKKGLQGYEVTYDDGTTQRVLKAAPIKNYKKGYYGA